MVLLDILIVVVVLAFIVTRFTKFKLPHDDRPDGKGKGERGEDWRQVLGRTFPRPDGRPDGQPDKNGRRRGGRGDVVDVTPVAQDHPETPAQAARRVAGRVAPKPLKRVDLTGMSGLEQIHALEPGFNEERFLDGARNAYRYFYERWNAADEEALENLCAPQLLNQLVHQLDGYAERGEQPQVLLEGELMAEIADARVNGRTAIVEVEFVTQQMVDGGPAHPVRSRWTLARPLGSDDPNWELQQILELGGNA